MASISHQAQHTLEVETHGQGLYEITDQVVSWVNSQQAHMGQLTVYCQHTSASLTIQENADPDVCHDLDMFSHGWSVKIRRCTAISPRAQTICQHIFALH